MCATASRSGRGLTMLSQTTTFLSCGGSQGGGAQGTEGGEEEEEEEECQHRKGTEKTEGWALYDRKGRGGLVWSRPAVAIAIFAGNFLAPRATDAAML